MRKSAEEGGLRFRTLLLRRLEVRSGPWRVHRVVLHHHPAENRSLGAHRHTHAQLLCYLSGSGRVRLGKRSFAVHTGHVVHIPAGLEHGFEREAVRNPLCLVMDFSVAGRRRGGACVAHADAAMMARVRRGLSELWARHRAGEEGAGDPATGAAVLTLFDLLLRAAGLVTGGQMAGASPLLRKVRLVIAGDARLPVGEIARRAGWNKDYLNRMLRRETGLTLGQIRDEHRLRQARQRLMEHSGVGEAALACGFEDANYFSRWFKKQTGMTPREFVGNFGGKPGGNVST